MARIIHHREDALHIGIVRAWSFYYGKYAHHFGIETPEEWRLLLHHSPYGGKRSESEAARFKAMGTRKGFPTCSSLYPAMAITEHSLSSRARKVDYLPSRRHTSHSLSVWDTRPMLREVMRNLINN
jgi:uridine phosphorylase